MRKYGASVFFLVLIATAFTLACGSSTRILQSVSLSPPAADAQSGSVQFTATGYFNQQPSPAKLLTASWGACYQNQRTTAVSVAPTAWPSARRPRLGPIQFGPGPSVVATPAAPPALFLRTPAAAPANAKSPVQHN
jgi:hypothetical protein